MWRVGAGTFLGGKGGIIQVHTRQELLTRFWRHREGPADKSDVKREQEDVEGPEYLGRENGPSIPSRDLSHLHCFSLYPKVNCG